MFYICIWMFYIYLITPYNNIKISSRFSPKDVMHICTGFLALITKKNITNCHWWVFFEQIFNWLFGKYIRNRWCFITKSKKKKSKKTRLKQHIADIMLLFTPSIHYPSIFTPFNPIRNDILIHFPNPKTIFFYVWLHHVCEYIKN